MSTIGELFAPKFYDRPMTEELPKEVTEKMAEEIGADSLQYLKHSALVDSIGLPKKDLCMACLNGDYPTKCGRELFQQAKENCRNGKCGRTYE